jgi:arylsulfate sulfotransferase
MQEINLLGKIERAYWAPQGIHHDAIQLPSGNYLVATQNDDYHIEDAMLEIDRQTGGFVNEINLRDVFQTDFYFNKDTNEKIQDWAHLNTIWYDSGDRSILISCRERSIVCKLSYPEAEIKWILAPEQDFAEPYHDKLLKPVAPGFKYPEAQHAPMKLSDLDNNPYTIDIVLFDNNNKALRHGATVDPSDAVFSQGVHYRIDEKNMTVEEIWAYGKEESKDLFSPGRGDANYYEDAQNYLISFTGLHKEGIDSSVLEVTRDKEIVFHVDVGEAELYRSERMSLYPENWLLQFPGESLINMAP